MNDPLLHLPTLAAIAATGSFSRAAEALDVNRAAISKRIARLEAALGVPVLTRTTRRVALTEAGRALLERHHQVQGLLLAGVDEARGIMSVVAGPVSVRCSSSALAVHLVGPALLAFAQRKPDIRVDLSVATSGPAAEPADIELRITDAPALEQSARALARVNWAFHASTEYLCRRGLPTHPRQLVGHTFVVPREFDRPSTFVHRVNRRTVTLHSDPAMTSNIQEVIFELVRRGEIIGLLPSHLTGSLSAPSMLRPILPQWRLQRLPAQTLYAIHPPARYQRAATRAVLDELTRVCAAINPA